MSHRWVTIRPYPGDPKLSTVKQVNAETALDAVLQAWDPNADKKVPEPEVWYLTGGVWLVRILGIYNYYVVEPFSEE